MERRDEEESTAAIIPSTESSATMADEQSTTHEDEADHCRICRDPGSAEEPLFYPCKCSGSIRFVHQDCLMQWLDHSQKKYCELCKTAFTFTKLYDNAMPSKLPLALFFQQAVVHAGSAFLKNMRYVAVTLIWLCWLPWSIRQVWRGLFWLADGSWVASSARLQEAALSELAAVGSNSNSTGLSAVIMSQNTTEVTSTQLHFRTSLFSGFVGLFTGDFLLIELAKLIFPSLGRWSQDLVSSDAADDPVILLTMDRQPSLLSNVGYVNSLTKYRLINGALVDVFEGQLICLFIVVAFILVFLIREWVINQQPLVNMPDPDAADPPQPAEARAAAAARAARRRQRGLRANPPLAAAVPGPHRQGVAPRRLPVPRPRRRPNLDVGLDMAELQRNDLPEQDLPEDIFTGTNSHTDTALHVPALPNSPSEIDSNESDAWVDEDEDGDARPPPPIRGAFDDLRDTRRSIEEGVDISTRLDGIAGMAASTATFSDTVNFSADLEATSSNEHPVFAAAEREVGRDGKAVAVNDQSAILPDLSSPSTPSSQPEKPESSRPRSDSSKLEARFMTPSGEGTGVPADTITSEDDDQDSDTEDVQTEPAIAEEIVEIIADPMDAAEHAEAIENAVHQSTLEKIFDWFWTIHDDPLLEQALREEPPLVNQEPILGDRHADALALPFNNHEPEVVAAVEAEPPPAIQEPNILFGVDLNNPDAMEDAEDLDGILELIGLQGPIAGMIQNVIFSEFLITITIAASIWLPYIWGKIALLVLANPIGVFIRAPLFLLSRTSNFALDLVIFIFGVFSLAIAGLIHALLGLVGGKFSKWHYSETLKALPSNMTRASGNRLEEAFSGTLAGIRPDLPTFSLRSHHAMRIIESRLRHFYSSGKLSLETWVRYALQEKHLSLGSPAEYQQVLKDAIKQVTRLPKHFTAFTFYLSALFRDLQTMFHHSSSPPAQVMDIELSRWNTKDKFLAIVLGYLFFASIGYIYLRSTRIIFNLRAEEKVEGVVADCLRQAGGVVKVVVIIGIEMIVFPLYCGVLLDIALLPLFEGATLHSRIAFVYRAPVVGVFVHWFIGTCYMFHFALFVAMCRKIFRKGVLYFIRDPDDPTFHPVRDVLERPVMTQFSKIAFSGLIYGGLVYLCLGGVVHIVSRISGVLPIHWSSNQPQSAFPLDIILYNFLLPFILRKARPSKLITAMYGWWFRVCAHALRLSNFLFGEKRPEERGTYVGQSFWSRLTKQKPYDPSSVPVGEHEFFTAASHALKYFVPDGRYVRAPASDSVRIPKGHTVFLEVNNDNERIDGAEDKEKGMHGYRDERFTQVWLPPNFKARITAFVVLLWLFAATTGVAFTVGPLLLGRLLLSPLTSDGIPPNDLYALTVGLQVGALLIYAAIYLGKARKWARGRTTNFGELLSLYLYPTGKYLLGLIYLGVAGCVFPTVFCLVAELYIHIPIHEYLSSRAKADQASGSDVSLAMPLSPTIFLLQTWTVGFVLMRLILQDYLGDPVTSRPARAIRAIFRRGYSDPDVGLATRALLIPGTLVITALWLSPLAVGYILNLLLKVQDPDRRVVVFRYSYPFLAGHVGLVFFLLALKRRLSTWRSKIRDEVYLIGERLHNYQEVRESSAKGQGSVKVRSERVEVG